MTKTDIIEKIAKDADITKAAAEKALNSFMDIVKKALKKGDKVALVGFGTFAISKRAARNGRNPRTGETIKIKAARVPKFTAGKGFKDSVK
jgi:DNA-binding protein HU-beta